MSINRETIVYPRVTESTPKLVTPNTTDIVPVEDFRNFLMRKTNNRSDQDDGIYYQEVIAAATSLVQDFTGLSLLTQGWRWKIDSFPANDELQIPRPPLISMTTITLIDAEDVETVFPTTSYEVDTDNVPGLLYIKTAPSVSTKTFRGIRLEYQAGYGSNPEDVPVAIKQAIMIWGHYIIRGRQDNVESFVPDEVYAILNQYAIR